MSKKREISPRFNQAFSCSRVLPAWGFGDKNKPFPPISRLKQRSWTKATISAGSSLSILLANLAGFALQYQ